MSAIDWSAAYAEHHRFVWGLSYRMMGVGAEADEIAQETFLRGLTHAPSGETPLRPWLARVAVNLCRDRLRRRRRAPYAGPWLPGPVDDAVLAVKDATPGAEARLGLAESATLACLRALEALRPSQRAVLLLRDVFDCSAEETAEILDMSPGNVRVVLHRARAALAERPWTAPTPEARAQITQALAAFLTAAAMGDVRGAAALLAPEAVSLTDGAGLVTAARRPVRGAAKVALFWSRLARNSANFAVELREVNGMPALVSEGRDARGLARRMVAWVELDLAGQVRGVYAAMAPAKLGDVGPVQSAITG